MNTLLEIMRQYQAGLTASGGEVALEDFGLEGTISTAMFARILREIDGTSRGLPQASL